MRRKKRKVISSSKNTIKQKIKIENEKIKIENEKIKIENEKIKIKNEKNKIENSIVIYEYLILIILILLQFILSYKLDKKIARENELRKQETIYNEIKAKYNTYVKTINDTLIYKLENGKYIEYGSISNNTELELEKKEIKDYQDIYFKLANLDYYIKYKDIEVIESMTSNNNYINYIPFNLNVITKNPVHLYSDEGNIYTINEELNKPIIIKENDKYYIEYDHKLLYLKLEDSREVIYNINSSTEEANSIPVILYHYVYNDLNKNECSNTIICHSIAQVRSQFNYLKNNNYYTTTMRELELWIDGKIRLPKNSITITIDDGWFLVEMIKLLEEFKLHGTLFLITSLDSPEVYKSNYLEIHSHTDKMHYVGACPGGQGSPIKCLDRQKILDDLKLSREKLNNTTYFSWPFYEYNDYSMDLIKEAGFTMAFKGGSGAKAVRGMNKYLIPRITIHNSTTVTQFSNYIK